MGINVEIMVSAQKRTVEFFALKNALIQMGILNDKSLQKGLKLIFPNKINLESLERVSLTDSFNYKEQIRFFLKERVIRNFLKLGKAISNLDTSIIFKIYNVNDLDRGSALFFQTISEKFENIQVLYESSGGDAKNLYSDEIEEKIESLILKEDKNAEELNFLKEQAQTYINCGDSWSAENLLNVIVKQYKSPEIYNMLGLSYMLQNRTIEAEYFYNLWRESAGHFDKAAANYSLSMLYLRHHPNELKSLDKAEFFLQEGLSELCKIEDGEREDLEFEKVFNRNGYALVVYRKGDVDSAVKILEDGIKILEQTDNYTAYLHRTVLIYNLAQCFKAKNDLNNAIKTYKKLLLLDPYFPEYHMEIAKCYMDNEEFNKGIEHLKIALELDDSIIEIHLLLGYALKETGYLSQSVRHYEHAYKLNSHNEQIVYDYAFVLAELGMSEDAKSILNLIELNNTEESLIADIISLKAEIYSNLYSLDKGLEILEEGLLLVPNNNQIEKNINFIRENYAS